ncbi:MAG: helicase-related protein, partial [Verrucomicrobia bacterium]|nr:helicase-related protein [Verrucomicrobiota bacterium]
DVTVFPGKQFVTPSAKMKPALLSIREELGERIAWFEKHGKLLEAQRIKMRTEYDLEMMEEMGFCSGIENYSRHIAGRPPGSRPSTLLDFFPKDYLLVIDESHATVPQIGGMYAGDRSRKSVLVDYGFRLPSALDNRPLNFQEFQLLQGQTIYASATPSAQEIEWARQACSSRREETRFSKSEMNQSLLTSAATTHAGLRPGDAPTHSTIRNPQSAIEQSGVVELIVRPTGLVDPTITLKPLTGQIDDLIEESRKRADRKERVLVTTLTKRTAEELTDYLREIGINVRYLHSEIDAIERVEILRALRKGEFDVLIGINLLREGLDLPEVSLVAILDADKEGYLRSVTSLIQTAGRAARHLNGEVILYADVKTQSIQKFLAISGYRRQRQLAYNQEHGITPRSVVRAIEESLSSDATMKQQAAAVLNEAAANFDVTETIRELEEEMLTAANNLEFEKAALLRDQVHELKRQFGQASGPAKALATKAATSVSYRKGKKRRG